jgi:soluble cytochrome b562
MSPTEIANKLNRRIEPVQEYLIKLAQSLSKPVHLEQSAEFDLVKRHFWKDIVSQFDYDEQETFVHLWGKIIGQFRKDVLPTEEMTIIDAIKMEILMNRCLRKEMDTTESIKALELQLDIEKRKETSDQDRDSIFNTEKQIASLRAGVSNYSKDFKDFQKEKTNLLSKLKATRDLRIKSIEDRKESFSGLVSRLVKDIGFADKMSADMEKLRIAAESAKIRMSDYFDYGGEVDQPFLNCDSVIGDPPLAQEHGHIKEEKEN